MNELPFVCFSSGFRTQVEVLPVDQMDFSKKDVAGVFFQYPDTTGNIYDPSSLVARAKEHGVTVQHPSIQSSLHLFVDCGHLWFRSACSLFVETSWRDECGYLLWKFTTIRCAIRFRWTTCRVFCLCRTI